MTQKAKPEDDIVWNSRIPMIKSRIPWLFIAATAKFRGQQKSRILRINLEFLEIASLRSQ
ncbi:hypothetical protein [Campylobacter sp.]|uniref:hypothetical protein n=1 Tax=Campylobacter sp. TaxID=205 RepID=UPI002A848FE5|nr:hypothetical protein [Campylobacter sp.]MCI7236483.1 hypothetical protein [Campylobacter sp.]MDY4830437.1 hypothetical protein [Campylobacter sp.]